MRPLLAIVWSLRQTPIVYQEQDRPSSSGSDLGSTATTLLKPQHVMWIYGYVGCGKSSIAQAISEVYSRKNRLIASFFFFGA
ncbi:hypothetical protein NMY22_g12194 [Coprinellus aureogranulatus]|nr:hypothetical protein NMY22_g12194 [Coprinellus aureogranulatus]